MDTLKNTHTLVASCQYDFPLMVASNEGRLGSKGLKEIGRYLKSSLRNNHELPSISWQQKILGWKILIFFWLKLFSGSSAPDDDAGHCAASCTSCLCTPASRTDQIRRPDQQWSLKRLQHLQRGLRQLQAVHPLVHTVHCTPPIGAQARPKLRPPPLQSTPACSRGVSCSKPDEKKLHHFSLWDNLFYLYLWLVFNIGKFRIFSRMRRLESLQRASLLFNTVAPNLA